MAAAPFSSAIRRRDVVASRFHTTRWSLVLAAGDPDSPVAQAALASLCESYWYPVSRAVITTLDFPGAGVWRSPVFLPTPPTMGHMADVAAVFPTALSDPPLSLVDFPRAISAAMNGDGSIAAAWSWDHVIRVWNTLSGTQRAQLRGHTNLVSAVAFSDDGTRLLSGSHDGSVRLWNIDAAAQIASLEGPQLPVTAIAYHDSPSLSAAGTDDGSIWVWSRSDAPGRSMSAKHEGRVTSLAFSPDGTLLASASLDRTVRVWDLSTRSAIRLFRGHPREVQAVSFSPDGRIIASGGVDSAIRVWSIPGQPADLALSEERALILAFTADSKSLMTNVRGVLTSRETHTGRVLTTQQLPREGPDHAAVSPRGDRIAVGLNLAGPVTRTTWSPDTVRIFDAGMTNRISELRCSHTRVLKLLFDPSGQSLATVAATATAKFTTLHVWNADSGRLIAERDLDLVLPKDVAFSEKSGPARVTQKKGARPKPSARM